MPQTKNSNRCNEIGLRWEWSIAIAPYAGKAQLVLCYPTGNSR
jgi:hypothetical protein